MDEGSRIKPYNPVHHHSPSKNNERESYHPKYDRGTESPIRPENIDYPHRAPRWTESGYDARMYNNPLKPQAQRPANTLNYSFVPQHSYPDYSDASPPRNIHQDRSVRYYPLRNSKEFAPHIAPRPEVLEEMHHSPPHEVWPLVRARDDFDTKPAAFLSQRPRLLDHDPFARPLFPEMELEQIHRHNGSKSRKGSKKSRGTSNLLISAVFIKSQFLITCWSDCYF